MLQSIRRPGRAWTDWTRHAPRKRGSAKTARRDAPMARFSAWICLILPLCSQEACPGAGGVRFFVPDDPKGCAGLEFEGTFRPLLVCFSPRDAICEYMRTYGRHGAFSGPTVRLEAAFAPDLWRCLSEGAIVGISYNHPQAHNAARGGQ